MQRDQFVAVLGEAIELARSRNNFTLGQLARELGFSRQDSLTAWRKGETETYDFARVVRLFELAGMSIDEVFGLRRLTGNEVLDFERDESADLLREVRGMLSRQATDLNAIREGIYLLVNRQSERQSVARDDVRRDAERVLDLLTNLGVSEKMQRRG